MEAPASRKIVWRKGLSVNIVSSSPSPLTSPSPVARPWFEGQTPHSSPCLHTHTSTLTGDHEHCRDLKDKRLEEIYKKKETQRGEMFYCGVCSLTPSRWEWVSVSGIMKLGN